MMRGVFFVFLINGGVLFSVINWKVLCNFVSLDWNVFNNTCSRPSWIGSFPMLHTFILDPKVFHNVCGNAVFVTPLKNFIITPVVLLFSLIVLNIVHKSRVSSRIPKLWIINVSLRFYLNAFHNNERCKDVFLIWLGKLVIIHAASLYSFLNRKFFHSQWGITIFSRRLGNVFHNH